MLETRISATADLNRESKKVYLNTLFATEDNAAHRFDISLERDGALVALPSGTTVRGYFIRCTDMVTVMLEGSAEDSVVSLTLNKNCYNKAGQFVLVIKVLIDDETVTVFYGEGTMSISSTGAVIDSETIYPTTEEILAKIETLEKAADTANTAAANANAATETANTAAANANAATETANTAAANANAKAEEAVTAVYNCNVAASKALAAADSLSVSTIDVVSMICAGVATAGGTAQIFIPLPVTLTEGTVTVALAGVLWAYTPDGIPMKLDYASATRTGTGVKVNFTCTCAQNICITVPDVTATISVA